MFEVTDVVLDHLKNTLSQSNETDGDDCFRMVAQDDKIALVVQSPQSGDQTFGREGATVLALPEPLSETLSERILDLGEEGQLVFRPKPN